MPYHLLQAPVPLVASMHQPARRRLLCGLAGVAAASLGGASLAQGSGKTLRIASTVDLTRTEKVIGLAIKAGAEACVRAANAAGGIHGARVELVTRDDGFDPAAAKANAKAFQGDAGMLAILHPEGTRQAAAVMEAVPDMAIVGPISGTMALRAKAVPNVFYVRANYDDEMSKLVALAHTVGFRQIGMIHADDPFGHSLLSAFSTACSTLGIKPAVVATTPATTSLEVAPAAKRVAQAAPQMVIVGLAGTMPQMVRALREADFAGTLYGMSVGASTANIEALGPLARGLGFSVVVPSPFALRYRLVREYQRDMNAAGSHEYTLPGLEGYVNARVLLEGMRQAGANPSRDSVLAALGRLGNLDLGGMRFNYSNGRREGGHFVDLVVVGAENRLLS